MNEPKLKKKIDTIIETLAFELDPDGEFNEENFKRDVKAKVKAQKDLEALFSQLRQDTIKDFQREIEKKSTLTIGKTETLTIRTKDFYKILSKLTTQSEK